MRNFGFMGASTAVRLGLGLVTFAVMARVLGAEDFGRLMTALAIATMVGLIANFGFATYALREIGAVQGDEARAVMSEMLAAKMTLVFVVGLVALAALFAAPAGWPLLLAWMLLAQLCDAITDLLNVGFRATGRYADETRVATVAAVLQWAVVSGALALWPEVHAAAAALALARLLVLALTWRGQRGFFGPLRPAGLRAAGTRISAARPYAADYALQSLFGQMDSVVLAHFFGPSVVGLYQAGMRVFLGLAQAGSVLGNVFIPRLSALHKAGKDIRSAVATVQYAFLGAGCLGGFALSFLPASWIERLLGRDYGALAGLMPWFGLLFILRFAAAMSGMLLTVIGAQKERARLTALHWVVVAIAAILLLPQGQAQGWLMALCIGNAVLSLSYVVVGLRGGRLPLLPLPLLGLGTALALSVGRVMMR